MALDLDQMLELFSKQKRRLPSEFSNSNSFKSDISLSEPLDDIGSFFNERINIDDADDFEDMDVFTPDHTDLTTKDYLVAQNTLEFLIQTYDINLRIPVLSTVEILKLITNSQLWRFVFKKICLLEIQNSSLDTFIQSPEKVCSSISLSNIKKTLFATKMNPVVKEAVIEILSVNSIPRFLDFLNALGIFDICELTGDLAISVYSTQKEES